MSLIVDPEIYYRQKEHIIAWFYRQGRQDVGFTIGTISTATQIPCITIAVWLGEERGFDEDLINRIKCLIKFYGYTTLLNSPPNFPEGLFKSLER